MKGGIPVLEYDQKVIDARYASDEEYRKIFVKDGKVQLLPQRARVSDGRGGFREATDDELADKRITKYYDTRDLSYRLARLQSSDYANSIGGFIADVRDGDKWSVGLQMKQLSKEGMPLRNPAIAKLVSGAEADRNLREQAALALAGFDAQGRYDASRQQVRIYSSPDYYSTQKSTFGKNVGTAVSRAFYSAFTERQQKLHEYLAAQALVRSMVSRYKNMASEWTTSGEQRFDIHSTKYKGISVRKEEIERQVAENDRDIDAQVRAGNMDKKYANEHKKLFRNLLESESAERTAVEKLEHEHAKRLERRLASGSIDAAEYERQKKAYSTLLGKAESYHLGEDGWLSSLHAFGWKFRSQVASRTISEIAETEATWLAKKKELKALTRLSTEERRNLGIDDAEYGRLKSELQEQKSYYKIEKRETRKDFKYLNESVISWVGSHDQDYGAKRNIFTKWWIFQKLLDSKYRLGSQELMYAVEAATMRSTQVALGMHVTSFEQAHVVGLETGQGMYEPAHMWLNSGSWERNYRPYVAFSRAQHKALIPYVSKFYGDLSGMPSYLQKTEMESARRGRRFFGSTMFFTQTHSMSDFFAQRINSIRDKTGISSMINAYVGTRSPSSFRAYLGSNYYKSKHIGADAASPAVIRYLDKFDRYEQIKTKNDQLKSSLAAWRAEADTDRKEKLWHDVIADNADIRKTLERLKDSPDSKKAKDELEQATFRRIPAMEDLRPVEIKAARRAGKYFYDDGSRNRFMNLYLGYHQNIWKPWVPGMTDVDPLTNQMENFPQVANIARNATGGPLAAMRRAGYTVYDSENKAVYGDWLSTDRDAFRDVYRKDNFALLQLMKYQNDLMGYSGMTPYLETIRSKVGAIKQKVGLKKPEAGLTNEYNEYMRQTIGYGAEDLDYIVRMQHARWMEEELRKKPKWRNIPLVGAVAGGFQNKAARWVSPETKHHLAAQPFIHAGKFMSEMFGKELEVSTQFRKSMDERNSLVAQSIVAAQQNRRSDDTYLWSW
ncbi:Uncharacterised protein [uncultured archaeon]|nr:Uncharacterised protein [uncultured archaeon]